MLLYSRLFTIFGGYYDTSNKIYEAVRRRKWAITFVVIGLASILSGISMYIIDPYNVIYKFKVQFTEGGEIFELWRNPPADLYLKVYLWNVTNKDEFMSGQDQKLKVQEIGPYVYKELMSHKNATFLKNGTVSVVPSHPLVFVPEMSEGRLENDSMILPNIALLSITDVLSDSSYFTRLGLNMVIRQTDQHPLVKMTAREFMFNYTNALMSLGNKFMSSWITFENLGLIDRMYDFDGDFETVYTGEGDYRKAGLIDSWRGSTKIPQWDSPCGDVRGASDGTRFPSHIKPDEKLFFYRKSMCRAKHLVKVNETVACGFKSYVYNFENGDDWNQQNCFCNNKRRCNPKGLLDVDGCYYGFPIALSSPHFYNNDPILNAKVEGMQPDAEKHRSYFVIEPLSGTPIELKANFQINMNLRNLDAMANVGKFSNMVLPLLWAEFRLYKLSDIAKIKLFFYVQFLPPLTDFLTYGSFIGGILLSLFSIWKLTKLRKFKNNRRTSSQWMQDAPNFFQNGLSIRKNNNNNNNKSAQGKNNDMDGKELETYFNSVIVPLTHELEVMEKRDGTRKSSATA